MQVESHQGNDSWEYHERSSEARRLHWAADDCRGRDADANSFRPWRHSRGWRANCKCGTNRKLASEGGESAPQ